MSQEVKAGDLTEAHDAATTQPEEPIKAVYPTSPYKDVFGSDAPDAFCCTI